MNGKKTKTRFITFVLGSKNRVVTVGDTGEKVRKWVKSRGFHINRFKREGLVIGISAYGATDDHEEAHTLAICLGNRVLLMDLQKLKKKFPKKLRRLLKASTIWGLDMNYKVRVLKNVGLGCGSVVDLGSYGESFGNMVSEEFDQNDARVKQGDVTDEAAKVAAVEALACFEFAVSTVREMKSLISQL